MPNQPTNQLTHDQVGATLGNMTHIMSHLLPQKQATQQPQAPQTPETAPSPPTNQETGTDLKAEMQGLEGRIFDELDVLKQEIQKSQPQDANKELQDLKTQLQAIIDGKDE